MGRSQHHTPLAILTIRSAHTPSRTTVCGHDSFVWYDSLEFCGNRSLSAYSIDIWTVDMCKDKTVICRGLSDWYCDECVEDHTLEYELDERALMGLDGGYSFIACIPFVTRSV